MPLTGRGTDVPPSRASAIEAYRLAMTDARYFAAHEILEDVWRPTKAADLQAAIWVAAAYLHWQRGNYPGAQRLAQRVADRLRANPGGSPDLARRVGDWVALLMREAPYQPISAPLLEELCGWLNGADA